MENKYIGKKLVDIHTDVVCYGPFNRPFKGSLFNQVLTTGDIRYLLSRSAKVTEILTSGERVELTLDNYNTWLDEGDAPTSGYEPKVIPKTLKEEKKNDEPVEEPRRNKKKDKNRRRENDQVKQEYNQHTIKDDISESSEDKEDVLEEETVVENPEEIINTDEV